MKALLRKDDETVTEEDGIDGIDWETGAPLTNSAWCGGPYKLVEEYTPPHYNENGEIIPDNTRYTEIAALKARLAALEKEV